MSRQSRLLKLTQCLETQGPHRAMDLATATGASLRTIYRDIAALRANGVDVKGTQGTGYTLQASFALPPITISPDELGALHLGLALVAQSTDASLSTAARDLSERIEASLPTTVQTTSFAQIPRNTAQVLARIPTLRAAILARQKISLSAPDPSIARPLKLEYIAQIWACTIWNETAQGFEVIPVDGIAELTVLPELFVDEAGKTLGDVPASLAYGSLSLRQETRSTYRGGSSTT